VKRKCPTSAWLHFTSSTKKTLAISSPTYSLPEAAAAAAEVAAAEAAAEVVAGVAAAAEAADAGACRPEAAASARLEQFLNPLVNTDRHGRV
jgi:hypothetical protein